jgi:hypothetical protein
VGGIHELHIFHLPNVAEVGRARATVFARDVAVPLGSRHDTEAILRQGEQSAWMPAPNTVDTPSVQFMQGFVGEQIRKMKGRALPGFDFMAACLELHACLNSRRHGWLQRMLQTCCS